MNFYFIDTHAHLFWQNFSEDIEKVLERALSNNVKKIVLPNVDLQSIPLLKKTVLLNKQMLYPLMGLHPSSVKSDYKAVLLQMEQELKNTKYYGIGEIGIDLYWEENKKFVAEQKQAFRLQLQWAKQKKLPVVIHTRNSFEIVYNIVKEENDDSLMGVFHCFTGSYEQAMKVIDLGGFYLGIGGVITFKNSKLAQVIKQIPINYLVLETDSPFLTPYPHRGKRNESSYIPLIAQKLSEIKNIPLSQVASITTQNALSLFKI